jgi:hypothetical protein
LEDLGFCQLPLALVQCEIFDKAGITGRESLPGFAGALIFLAADRGPGGDTFTTSLDQVTVTGGNAFENFAGALILGAAIPGGGGQARKEARQGEPKDGET